MRSREWVDIVYVVNDTNNDTRGNEMNAKTRQDLERQYKQRHAAAMAQCQTIMDKLTDMPLPGDESLNWSNLGDLGHVNHELTDVVNFLTGEES